MPSCVTCSLTLWEAAWHNLGVTVPCETVPSSGCLNSKCVNPNKCNNCQSKVGQKFPLHFGHSRFKWIFREKQNVECEARHSVRLWREKKSSLCIWLDTVDCGCTAIWLKRDSNGIKDEAHFFDKVWDKPAKDQFWSSPRGAHELHLSWLSSYSSATWAVTFSSERQFAHEIKSLTEMSEMPSHS